MRAFHPIALAAVLVPAIAGAASGPAKLVNPLIGTTNGGNVFPGTVVRNRLGSIVHWLLW